jgi:hypothetical protein
MRALKSSSNVPVQSFAGSAEPPATCKAVRLAGAATHDVPPWTGLDRARRP